MPSISSTGNQLPEARYEFHVQEESPKEPIGCYEAFSFVRVDPDDVSILRNVREVARRELAKDLKECGVDEAPSEADVDKRVQVKLRELSAKTAPSQTLSPGRKAFFAE